MNAGPSKVIIVGGGVAALEAALALQELAGGVVEVELVAPEQTFAYRPLLVAEPFGAGQVRTFPLRRLAESAGASFREAIVTGVDSDRHLVRTAAGDELPFDLLLLAPGAVPVQAVPGAICFRGPTEAKALRQLIADAAGGMIDRITFAVPSGASWPLPLYELALLTRSYLVDEGAVGVSVAVVTPEDRPLGLFGPTASDAVRELLEARGIELSPLDDAARVRRGRAFDRAGRSASERPRGRAAGVGGTAARRSAPRRQRVHPDRRPRTGRRRNRRLGGR
jgi:sulfide:quinone oxidoreductase